jgi:anti-anti-sigma regulatory factor
MAIREKKQKVYPSSGQKENKPVTVAWGFDECTDRTASRFSHITWIIRKSGFKNVVLDFAKCKFLSVGGLRHLLEWHADLENIGVEVKVTGLSSMLEYIFSLAKLDWILVKKNS